MQQQRFVHLKSGNFLLDFLDSEDLQDKGVVSVMKTGGVTKELAGVCGLRADTDEALDSSPLLLPRAGAGANTDGLSSVSLRAPGRHATVRDSAKW